ncbi:unnamed protein product [Periconia digitata]|uniref:DUF3824 domain-containing protein n=1 Tax=Periconia digitata TaxID=1303443 RepID=A0A9W4UGU3_9PLEO|nr:unnamed protein product [Periconia digitata]
MSTVYRAEREREREWETSSHGGRSYTTVKRYKIPDRSLEEDTYESEMRLVHRSRDPVHERRETHEYHHLDHDDSRDREVREYRYTEREVERSPSPVRHEVREYRIEREVERSPSPPNVREYRVERQYDLEPPREPYGELERYSRSTEFFRPEQPPPQPIVIRNEAPQPIIVQEPAAQQIIVRREEPAYELVERREPRREEDYYYERKVKEIDRGRRHHDRYYDEREYGRERDAYSDDELVYVHKEKDTWGRDSSPGSKRHIAGGVIAGVGAAQVLRHHRKRQGEDPGHAVRQAVGYGALGAVGAEVINRVRNRSRSSSYERDSRGRRHHRSKSRHRSRSSSRVKKIGTLAAVAGIGALAYAAGRKNNKVEKTTVIEDRRSRSRRRKSSVSRSRARSTGSRGRSASRPASESALDPEHRNRRAAQAGLATAAVAGIVEHHRNKSRERKGERSRSRIRTGVPIAAAGVAGAAVTGLYERQKAKKEAKELSRSRSRSRSKSRSKSVRSDRRHSTASDGGLVEYGGSPIYSDPAPVRRTRDYDDPADYRHRRRSSSSSSSGGRRRRQRSRSSRSRSRSKSRTRKAAETAAVAGVAGLAAHEAAKRRDRKKAEKERQRREEDSAYSTGSYSPPPTTVDGQDPRYFPQTNYFPPPPHQSADPQYPPYNPADYPAPPQHSTYPQQHIDGGLPPTGYTPEPGNPYAHQDPRYRRQDDNVSAQQYEPLLEHMQARRDRLRHKTSEPIRNGYIPHASSPIHQDFAFRPANHESPINNELQYSLPSSPATNHRKPPSPVAPVAVSDVKSVKFDLNPQEKSPDRDTSRSHSERASSDDEPRRHRDAHERDSDRRSRHRRREDERGGRSRRDESADSATSEGTIELPPRFDEQGRRKEDDPLADQLESVLAGLFR